MESDVRLALFCDSYLPQLNGVSLLLERLVNALRARGGAVRVYTTTDPNATDDPDIRRWPSVVFPLYPEHRLALPTPRSVKREFLAWRPTLVHAASPFGLGLAARAGARALGIPFVTSYHTSWSAYTKYYGLGALSQAAWSYIRWFHNSALRTYCPTIAIQEEIESHGVERTGIWSRGVDTQKFSPAWRSAAMRRRIGADDGTIVVAYVGRIGKEKGLNVALKGLHGLADRVVIALAGDGPYEAEARRIAPPGTVFMGRLAGRELSEFYASADVFMFPSSTDTFGNVILEAMASGLPVIGADVGPTRELLGGRRGLTFPEGDAAAFGDRVLALANDPAKRITLGREALAFARTRTWELVFDELFADYSRILDGAPTEELTAS